MKKNWSKILNSLYILIFAAIIFFVSESNIRYVPIDEFSEPIVENGSNTYDITQEYTSISIDRFENIIDKMNNRIKYSGICFRDEGSTIPKESPVVNLTVGIIYQNFNQSVSVLTKSEHLYGPDEKCYSILNKENITWNWYFYSSIGIDFENIDYGRKYVLFSPDVNTYLKVNWIFTFYNAFLSLFFSGIFWWALTRIWTFINNGFKI